MWIQTPPCTEWRSIIAVDLRICDASIAAFSPAGPDPITIKSNSLTHNENKRVIKPDNKLKTLLGTDEETVITYFNIQRFMNRHFIKNKSNVTSSEK